MTDSKFDSSITAQHQPVAMPVFCLALGVIAFLVSWLAADAPGQGLEMLGIMIAYASLLRFGQRYEAVQVLSQSPEKDERHKLIQQRALAVAYYAVAAVALIGFIWELANGTTGTFALICFVGGTTHILATVILRCRI